MFKWMFEWMFKCDETYQKHHAAEKVTRFATIPRSNVTTALSAAHQAFSKCRISSIFKRLLSYDVLFSLSLSHMPRPPKMSWITQGTPRPYHLLQPPDPDPRGGVPPVPSTLAGRAVTSSPRSSAWRRCRSKSGIKIAEPRINASKRPAGIANTGKLSKINSQ